MIRIRRDSYRFRPPSDVSIDQFAMLRQSPGALTESLRTPFDASMRRSVWLLLVMLGICAGGALLPAVIVAMVRAGLFSAGISGHEGFWSIVDIAVEWVAVFAFVAFGFALVSTLATVTSIIEARRDAKRFGRRVGRLAMDSETYEEFRTACAQETLLPVYCEQDRRRTSSAASVR